MGIRTRELILETAMTLAEDIGFNKVSYRGISNRVGVKDGSVQYYFPKIDELKDEIVVRAISYHNLKIIGQAIAMEHDAIRNAPKQIINKTMRYLRGLNGGE